MNNNHSDELHYYEGQQILYYDYETKTYEGGRFVSNITDDMINVYSNNKKRGLVKVKLSNTRPASTRFEVNSILHFIPPYDKLFENIFGSSECILLKESKLCTIEIKGKKYHANPLLLTS